ncbi:oxalate/formate MFS antiporter [Ammoniphilus oxalaticus]|uniref:Oxalate/formate MFS antiporter n=1 Tax=Ammoniphilus oxalaticus TaxID=66863 RepID=A0A419SEL3_9BACL|nr:oxalate/formate MFS antiporter [Ammoniphilus oxalaticus]RKD21776.1 oxalate/formate MFS antiporter [Ammoniphilus oxalaticus]
MSTAVVTKGGFRNNRWVQLVIAILMMMSIACLQYAWELHAAPLQEKMGVDLSGIQYAFTVYVIFQTLIQPGGGFVVDKVGPKLTIIAGLAVGLGWAMMGNVNSLPMLYLWYAVAGSGAGLVYGCCVGMANKWFPDKRGLAAGLIAAGYGAGALPFIPAITVMIENAGITSTMTRFGILFAVVIVIGGLLLKFPDHLTQANKAKDKNEKKVIRPEDFTPGEMLRTPHFWVLYAIFTFVNLGGLLITANSVPYGRAIGIPVAMITLAASLKTASNGLSRVGWGWFSDKVGRYAAMGISFGLNAVCLILYPYVGSTPVGFVIMTTLVIFTWGAAYSIFPPATGDLFGSAYTTSNYGFVYSAKGIASVFGGGLGAAIAASVGWNVSFFIAAATSLVAAVLGWFVLPRMGKPRNKRMLEGTVEEKQVSV